MRATYKFLAYAVAALVVLQAAMIAFALFGLGKWVEDGNSLTPAVLEADEPPDFLGAIGFMIHGMNGMMLIPLVALLLLIVSFFTKIPGAAKWAGFVLLTVVVQVSLGMFGHGMPALGILHGANAFLLLWLAWHSARLPDLAQSAEVSSFEAASASR